MESVPSWAEHLVPWDLKLGEQGALGITIFPTHGVGLVKFGRSAEEWGQGPCKEERDSVNQQPPD